MNEPCCPWTRYLMQNIACWGTWFPLWFLRFLIFQLQQLQFHQKSTTPWVLWASQPASLTVCSETVWFTQNDETTWCSWGLASVKKTKVHFQDIWISLFIGVFFFKVFSQLGAMSKEILHNSSQDVQNRWPQNNLQRHPWCTCELFPLRSISEVTVKSMFRPHRNWIWPTTVIVGNVCLSCLSSTSTSYDTVDKNRVLSSCPSSLRSWTHCSSQWRLTSRPCWW